MELEAPMFHLPYKRLKNLFSTSTLAIEKDIQAIATKIQSLHANKNNISPTEASEGLSTLINRLESLQRKLEETNRQESILTDNLRARLNNVTSFVNSSELHDGLALKLWYRHQTDRLIVDFLVREGEYEKAAQFSLESNLSDFEDVDLFIGKVKPVVAALSRGDCKEVMKWMHSNSSKLKKLSDSQLVAKFELELRLQEFILSIQQGNTTEAIKFAQETFLPYTDMGEYFASRIKQAMSCLVFLGMKESPVAQEFIGEARWAYLIREFHKLFFSMYGLSEEPLLSIAVLSGLHALVTPTCQRHQQASHVLRGTSQNGANGHAPSSSNGQDKLRSSNDAPAVHTPGLSPFTTHGTTSASTHTIGLRSFDSGQTALRRMDAFASNGSSTKSDGPSASKAAAHTPRLNPDCPACSSEVGKVLMQIPLPYRPTSTLLCPITHQPLDDSNYPMALPNGNVYSKAAIDQGVTRSTASSSFTDPKTGESFDLSTIRRVFIM